jgi:hypothetical protein
LKHAELNNTYLGRLYRADKKVFALVSFFIVGTIYCLFNCSTFLFSNRCEEFPFLLYGMYSLREEPQETYTAYSLVIDGKEVNYSKLKDSQRELILSPLSHLSTSIDSNEFRQFKEWLFRYSVDMRGLETNKMDVYKLTCAYKQDGTPQVLKKELFYTYAIE